MEIVSYEVLGSILEDVIILYLSDYRGHVIYSLIGKIS